MKTKTASASVGCALPKPSSLKPKKAIRQDQERRFREAVWRLESGVCRATGQILYRVHEDWDRRGQVCHLRSRGAHRDLSLVTSNAILLSDHLHQLSDARGNCLLKILDAETGEKATDATRPIRFEMYTLQGTLLWTRITSRPA